MTYKRRANPGSDMANVLLTLLAPLVFVAAVVVVVMLL